MAPTALVNEAKAAWWLIKVGLAIVLGLVVLVAALVVHRGPAVTPCPPSECTFRTTAPSTAGGTP